MTEPKLGLDRSKTGRRKGTPNKTTALLKDAILEAAHKVGEDGKDRKSTRLNSSHIQKSRMPSSA